VVLATALPARLLVGSMVVISNMVSAPKGWDRDAAFALGRGILGAKVPYLEMTKGAAISRGSVEENPLF
jgi:hypothetical protein